MSIRILLSAFVPGGPILMLIRTTSPDRREQRRLRSAPHGLLLAPPWSCSSGLTVLGMTELLGYATAAWFEWIRWIVRRLTFLVYLGVRPSGGAPPAEPDL